MLDVSQGLAGPFAAMRLGDAGADVIKIEPVCGDSSRVMGPPFVDGESAVFLSINRNKRSLALDLGQPQGRDVLRLLCATADILIEDWGPGQAEAGGLSYDELRTTNPGLIWCSITPFGETGPMADLPGAEVVVQAMSDYMNSLGRMGDAPIRMGTDAANLNTGITASQAVTAALLARLRGGVGQRVSVSMLGTLLHLRGVQWTCMNNPDEWFGLYNDHYTRSPDHGYRTKDGRVYWGLRRGGSEDWKRLLAESGMDKHRNDPRFAEDGKDVHSWGRYAPEVKPLWEEAFIEKGLTRDDVIKLVLAVKGDAVPFSDYPTLDADEQVRQRGLFIDVEHPNTGTFRAVIPAWRFSDTPASVRLAPPSIGQHTREVLAAAGCDRARIDDLWAKGVVSGPQPT